MKTNWGHPVHTVNLDWETYSESDLRKVGAEVYARHKSTDILACSYSIDGGPVKRWRLGDPYPFRELHQGRIYAWNASFEKAIWNHVAARRYGWPQLDVHMFICTAALARLCSLPGKLENAARILELRTKKDMEGHNLMLQLCRPRMKGFKDERAFHPDGPRSHHTPDKIARLERYCDDDVRAEMQILSLLPEPAQADIDNYHVNERINERGLPVDLDFAHVAVTFAAEEKEWFCEQLAEITNGKVTSPSQHVRIKEWIMPRLSDDAYDMTLSYDKGEKKMSMDKATRENLLLEEALQPGFLDADVAEFVDILDQAGKSTIAKYQAMIDRSITAPGDYMPRAHGVYMFAGGQQTGRFSSTGIQVHNLYRLSDKDPLYHNAGRVMDAMITGDADAVRGQLDAKGNPVHAIHTLAKLVRPTICGCPDGSMDLVWGDWSAIEARVLPWLSKDKRALERLEIFATGEDIYVHTAKALGLEDRQTGKVVELACGFGGGEGSFQAMAKVYGVQVASHTAQTMVKAWREANPWASDFWQALSEASIAAVETPGIAFAAGRLWFEYDRDALGGIGALWMTLPSKRRLCYPGARIELVRTKWGGEKYAVTAMKAAWKPKEGAKEWPRVALWHGLLAENPTQAAAADLLLDGLYECEAAGLAVVGHTHDEIMLESSRPKRDAALLKQIMEENPPWAAGLPLAAETGSGFRYKAKDQTA